MAWGNEQAALLVVTNTPSLKPELDDPEWREIVWGDAVAIAERETGLSDLPEHSPWAFDQVRDPNFLPD